MYILECTSSCGNNCHRGCVVQPHSIINPRRACCGITRNDWFYIISTMTRNGLIKTTILLIKRLIKLVAFDIYANEHRTSPRYRAIACKFYWRWIGNSIVKMPRSLADFLKTQIIWYCKIITSLKIFFIYTTVIYVHKRYVILKRSRVIQNNCVQ